MRILHYALGFPPYRTGGLTKYCMDLMLTQKEQGHEVALLWPGQIKFVNNRITIKKRLGWKEIDSFEIINPLPIALDEGVLDVATYTKKTNSSAYKLFLNEFSPDVIHVHTLMGIHKEFFDSANEFNIRTLFTSHDYYGICPKVTLFHNGKICDTDSGYMECVSCNQSALSLSKIRIMQSPMYRTMKNTALAKVLRRQHRNGFFREENSQVCQAKSVNTAMDYQKLKEYYVSMLGQINTLHFNSTISKAVYSRYIMPKESKVISITHRDIGDHKRIKKFNHEKLRLTYLGPAKPFKGFQFLISVLDRLWEEGVRNFELHIYAEIKDERLYITHRQDGYSYVQLEEIFDNTDLLIVPSLWYETFGFTVIEALSYGVPVMVSTNVGAKIEIRNNMGAVVELEQDAFCGALRQIVGDRSTLCTWNYNICNDYKVKTMKMHTVEMVDLYKNRGVVEG